MKQTSISPQLASLNHYWPSIKHQVTTTSQLIKLFIHQASYQPYLLSILKSQDLDDLEDTTADGLSTLEECGCLDPSWKINDGCFDQAEEAGESWQNWMNTGKHMIKPLDDEHWSKLVNYG